MDGQTVAAQVVTLTAAGSAKMFSEVASGAKTDRTQLRRALDQLEAMDVLMVTRLDRLVPSTRTYCIRWPRSPDGKRASDPFATHWRLRRQRMGD
jgi:DNA invertase Pin-like site-specific DNA recombinase